MTISRQDAFAQIEARSRAMSLETLRELRARELQTARSYRLLHPEWVRGHLAAAVYFHEQVMALRWSDFDATPRPSDMPVIDISTVDEIPF